jgi:N6-adenosine-specific RNA methylase IME4
MDLDDIRQLPVDELAADDGAHIYLWSTQKHLPDAFEMLEDWGARFECLLTWVKPTGVAPFSWQYNTEHVLFARFGDGLQMNEMGQQISFEAPVSDHSQKPAVFYERVLSATPGPRLEMFAREPRDGFDVWGDEVAGGDGDGH